MNLQEIALQLMPSYHVSLVNDNTLSVIGSYKDQLEAIAKQYNLVLENVYNHRVNVQGIFILNK